jgi:hypothetical protein
LVKSSLLAKQCDKNGAFIWSGAIFDQMNLAIPYGFGIQLNAIGINEGLVLPLKKIWNDQMNLHPS